MRPVRKKLRILAAVVLLSTVAWWAAAGANRGWTRTNEPIKSVDSVTGLERIDWKSTFVPGFDFLAVSGMGAGFLFLVSFCFRKQNLC